MTGSWSIVNGRRDELAPPLDAVVNPLEAKSLWRHRGSRLGAITKGDDAVDVRWFNPSAPDLHDRSNKDAHHVVEEPTARHIEADDASLGARHRTAKQRANGRLALVGFMGEGAEVMRSNQARGGGAHARKVDRMTAHAGVTPLEGGGAPFKPARSGAVRNPQAVTVRLAHATPHGIERLIDLVRSEHLEIARQPRVQRHRNAVRWETQSIDAEGRHLTASVDPCVGPACPKHRNRCADEIVDRLRQDALRGAQFGKPWWNLPLPAVEVGSVVRDQKSKSRHGVCSAQWPNSDAGANMPFASK